MCCSRFAVGAAADGDTPGTRKAKPLVSPAVAGGDTQRPRLGDPNNDPAVGRQIDEWLLDRWGCCRPRPVVGRANEQARLADSVGVAVAVGGDRPKRALGDRLPAVAEPEQAIVGRRQRLADTGYRLHVAEPGVGQPVVIDAVDAIGRREQAGIDRTNLLGLAESFPGWGVVRRLAARAGHHAISLGDDHLFGCEIDGRHRTDRVAADRLEGGIGDIAGSAPGIDVGREQPLIGSNDKPVGRRRYPGRRLPAGKAERPDLIGRDGDSGEAGVGRNEHVGDAGFRAEDPFFGQRLHTCFSTAGGQKASRLRAVATRLVADSPAARSEQRYAGPHATSGHASLRYREHWADYSHTGGVLMRVVAKFGGTSLGTGERINRAADSIADAVAAGHQIAVVASAMGSTTDDLLDDIEFDVSDEDRAEIVSMGERTSVRMLKAALAARGVDALFLEPGSDEWPIITNDVGEVDVEATKQRAADLAADLDGVVPVITGFLAQNEGGDITTLGRGGSDTTAVMLGNYMNADEVVIVTDVEGVMTGDPRVVEGARNVGRISVDELRNLSFRGAEVVAPSALSYKHEHLDVRVVHYQHGDLLTGGTQIEGEFQNLIDMQEQKLACLTVAGRSIRNSPGILADLSDALRNAGINIDAVASGMDSITFYVNSDLADEAEPVLHERVVSGNTLSSVTVEDDIAVIRVTGGELPNRPGVIQSVLTPIADAGINLHDVITSATSVALFVAWDDREETLEIVQREV